MMIYPSDPVYVKRFENGIQTDIFDRSCDLRIEDEKSDDRKDVFFCFYHIMLRTLKYTNEIVVDISTNSVQALFWLGIAHGSDVYAISVRHEQTVNERMITVGSPELRERNIFDVSGLWTAILHSYDTEGFYKQLSLAQLGIEQQSKLLLKDNNRFEAELLDEFYKENEYGKIDEIKKILDNKRKQSIIALESYYRKRFWSAMIGSNQLNVYFPQADEMDPVDESNKQHNVKWDVDAIAALSHYLSKRKIIGKYLFKSLDPLESDSNSKKINFICIGDAARPLASNDPKRENQSLPAYVNTQISSKTDSGVWIRIKSSKYNNCPFNEVLHTDNKIEMKGFEKIGLRESMLTQVPRVSCYGCIDTNLQDANNMEWDSKVHSIMDTASNSCSIKELNLRHTQLAQLLLWKEHDEYQKENVHYWVSLTGTSGPSTLATSSILLDNEQKKMLFGRNGISDKYKSHLEDDSNTPLVSIQSSIRKDFLEKYSERLRTAVKQTCISVNDIEDDQADSYCERVLYASNIYLSVTLYKYFLPFISTEDENRICNGMRMYVYSLMVAGISPFSRNYPNNADTRYPTVMPPLVIEQCAKHTYMVLKKLLREFCGIEVMFEVQASVDEKKITTGSMSDARIINGIKIAVESKSDNKQESGVDTKHNIINCLYLV